MAGTVSTPTFVKDGQYLSFTTAAAITIGQVVELNNSGEAIVGTVADGTNIIIGVAVAGRRFSRTQTDDEIASGEIVTVCTRGVVRVLTGTSAILVGSALEAGAAGIVDLAGTAGTAGNVNDTIAMALEVNSSAEATIQVLLMRG